MATSKQIAAGRRWNVLSREPYQLDLEYVERVYAECEQLGLKGMDRLQEKLEEVREFHRLGAQREARLKELDKGKPRGYPITYTAKDGSEKDGVLLAINYTQYLVRVNIRGSIFDADPLHVRLKT